MNNKIANFLERNSKIIEGILLVFMFLIAFLFLLVGIFGDMCSKRLVVQNTQQLRSYKGAKVHSVKKIADNKVKIVMGEFKDRDSVPSIILCSITDPIKLEGALQGTISEMYQLNIGTVIIRYHNGKMLKIKSDGFLEVPRLKNPDGMKKYIGKEFQGVHYSHSSFNLKIDEELIPVFDWENGKNLHFFGERHKNKKIQNIFKLNEKMLYVILEDGTHFQIAQLD